MRPAATRNIWAVGRNYAEHAKEMKAEVPQSPMFFLKAGSCLTFGETIMLPTWSNDVHYELEVALLVDENLNFSHVTLALDLTARDAQSAAKAKGLPWTLAKSFTGACPLGKWIPLSDVPNMNSFKFTLTKNGNTVQSGTYEDMIFKPDSLLKHVKNFYPILPYDIILTGTPEGVGPVKAGDRLKAILQSDGNGESHEIFTCHWDVV